MVSFLILKKRRAEMDEQIMSFRKEHDCRYCLYFMKICKAAMYCVFDYLPMDSLEEDVVLFILG